MKRVLITALCLATLSASACASPPPPPTLPKEARGPAGEWLAVAAETKGDGVAWVALDEGLRVLPASLLKDQRTAHVFACRPGRYRLKAITCDGGRLSDWATCVVVVGEAAPAPTPADPSPAPLSGPAWVVVVEETSARTPEQAAVLADRQVGDYVRAKGWRMRVADRDARGEGGTAPRDLGPYLERARGQRLPYLIVVDGSGGVRHEGPLPADGRALLAVLSRVGGVR